MTGEPRRCWPSGDDDLMDRYHDEEWGVPAHEDRRHFEYLVLDAFVWEFVDGVTRRNTWKTIRQIPARTGDSDRLSEALKERGFTFVGSTICYAYMQAAGLVNDHLVGCPRHP